jgi:hypothetical protein
MARSAPAHGAYNCRVASASKISASADANPLLIASHTAESGRSRCAAIKNTLGGRLSWMAHTVGSPRRVVTSAPMKQETVLTSAALWPPLWTNAVSSVIRPSYASMLVNRTARRHVDRDAASFERSRVTVHRR